MTTEQPNEPQDVADRIAKYNAAYSSPQDFVQEPNAFLVSCLERIAKDGAPANSRAMPHRRIFTQTDVDSRTDESWPDACKGGDPAAHKELQGRTDRTRSDQ
jgi:hypothetical protein